MSKFLLYLLISVLSSLGFIYLYLKLNDAKLKLNLKIITLFILGMIFQTLIRYYGISFISSLSYFLIFPFLYYLIYPLPKVKLVFYVIIIWVYAMILDLITMLILSFTYVIIDYDVYNNFYIVFPSFIICILFFILGNMRVVKSFTNFLYKSVNKIKYYDFVLLLLAIFTLLAAIVFSINIQKTTIGILLFLTVFSILLVFITLIKMKFLDYEYGIFLDTLRENNNFYIKMDEENRMFKHNLLANLLSVKSVSNKASRDLINELISNLNYNVDFLNQLKNIPYGLTGIIYEKICPYNNKLDVKIDNKINYDIFDVLKPKRYNVLVEKLVLMIDNALEASMLSVDKVVIINMYLEGDKIVIEVKNSFRDSIDIDSLGKLSYSTKSNSRGFGLFTILRDNEVSVNVKIINNMFVAKLTAVMNNLER